MKEVKAGVIFLIIACLTVIVLFKTMSSMLVYNNATVIVSKEACPVGVTPNAYNTCTVNGTLTRAFVFNNVEVTLPDNTKHVFESKYLRGYVHDDNAVSYRPFGKTFALISGIIIIFLGFWVASTVPSKRSFSHYNQ